MARDLSIAAVIPAFNSASTIRRAIESVVSQSEPPEQIVVVDDGSSDGTADIAREYGSTVRVVRQENAGASAARNRGMAECQTTDVAFLDADDEWLPLKLSRQREILSSYPQLRWCFTHMVEVHDGRPKPQPLPQDIARRLAHEPIIPFFLTGELNMSTGTCGAVVNLDVVRTVGGFNPVRRIAEDRDLWWRIAMLHPQVGYSPEVSWRYYVDTPDSLMKESSDRSDSLQVVCEHLSWWRREQRTDFETYGRRLALNYLGRAASGQIRIDDSILAEAERLLHVTVLERALLTAMRSLPPFIAQRLAKRWEIS